MVGIQLKNLMKRFPQVAQNAAAQEALCTQVVVDTHVEIRKVGCSIISLAVREEVWPATPVLQSLVGVLQQKTNDLNAQHGIMRALAEITADAIANLDVNQVTHHVVNAAAPYLTQNLGDSPEALQVRENAFEVIMAVLENAGEAVDNPQQCYSHYVMQSGIVQVIEACFLNLQQPVSKSISVTCVKVLTLSLIFYDAIDENLFNRMADLMSQVLASSDDHSGRDEELRMAATDFFTVAPNIPKFYSLALTAVLKVIPIVIRSMVLSDMEMAGLQANKETGRCRTRRRTFAPVTTAPDSSK
ncbi:hypothetical protein AGDE_06280 [Angomonas deanei]|nr:hypothetical protein AGDE_06280 [Angomonas deanei]|eukprot:EPY37654.1 hypothetical protein AGDE_06280 [Angomonas deanei]